MLQLVGVGLHETCPISTRTVPDVNHVVECDPIRANTAVWSVFERMKEASTEILWQIPFWRRFGKMKTTVVVAVHPPQVVIIVRGEIAIQPARRKGETPLHLFAQWFQSRFVRSRSAEVPA